MRMLSLILLIITTLSCNSYKTKYPYAIKDFSAELRPGLEKIVTNGGMCEEFYADESYRLGDKRISFIDSNATIEDLQKLLLSEHPLLRAYAFKLLCRKKPLLINDILLNHLDDTAMISYCAGEFGDRIITVSDYILNQSEGNTAILKSEVIKKVITKHPYLSTAAFLFIYPKDSMQQYYDALKNIYLRNYPLHYNYRNELLVKLAAFKKPEDTIIIKEGLQRYWRGEKNEGRFQLIEDNPSPAFYFAIEKFYRQQLGSYYQNLRLSSNAYTYDENFNSTFSAFIRAAAAYKSERSATIFTDILKKNLYRGESGFYYDLFKALEKYNCPFYAQLLKQIERKARRYEAKYILRPIESSNEVFPNEKKTTW